MWNPPAVPNSCKDCDAFHKNHHPHPHCADCESFHRSMHCAVCDNCALYHFRDHKPEVESKSSNQKVQKPAAPMAKSSPKSGDWIWGKHKMDVGVYTGEWSDSHDGPHGFGTMNYYPTNAEFVCYEGGWDHGRRHGFGTMTYKSNIHGWSKYTGGWNEDVKHGNGIMMYFDLTSYYEGGWKADQRHGYAVFHYKSKLGVPVIFKGCYEMDKKWEGDITGKNAAGVPLEYFGRFNEDMFKDSRALVRIGGHQENRPYDYDIWKQHGNRKPDELECLKGEWK